MRQSYKVTSPATVEPVSLGEMVRQCRAVMEDDYPILEDKIAEAREFIERQLDRQFVQATYQLKMDRFPTANGGTIELRKPPIVKVNSIQYVDSNGETQSLVASAYVVDTHSEPGRIQPAFGHSWPATLPQMNAVTVEFVAGYGADGATQQQSAVAVPRRIKSTIAMLAAHLFENREASLEVKLEAIPFGVREMMDSCSWGNV